MITECIDCSMYDTVTLFLLCFLYLTIVSRDVTPDDTTVAILRELDAVYGTIFDFGAGDGKFLISAAAAGAKNAIGVEYAENIGHKLMFDEVVQRKERNHYLGLSVEWVGNYIEQV
jgi:predicted RNA methylase